MDKFIYLNVMIMTKYLLNCATEYKRNNKQSTKLKI